MKKIAVITGTRADYGLLKPVIRKICQDDSLELCLIVTGMHLSPEFGLTYKEIEEDGFPITNKVEMLLSADTPGSIVKSMGVELIGLADIYDREKPDVIMILGDRYEAMAAAEAAMLYRIPIAHIAGGELTEGAVDEAIRHCITKMSFWHFTATEEYRQRVIQLGESPERVFNIGAMGVAGIKKTRLLSKKEMESVIGMQLDGKIAVVTFHPVTLEDMTSGEQFANLLFVLEQQSDIKVVFTKANADTDGRVINQMIDRYVECHKENTRAFTSLGSLRYLSLLKFASVVIGNSSSGIVEAPSFGIPTINIGDRQKGRTRAESVIDCGIEKENIADGLKYAFSNEFQEKLKICQNPYEQENTVEHLVEILKKELEKDINLKKEFYDLKDRK